MIIMELKTLNSIGYGFIAKPKIDKNTLERFRDLLESEFKSSGYPKTMNFDEIKI